MYYSGGVKRFALLDRVTHKDKFPQPVNYKDKWAEKVIFFYFLCPLFCLELIAHTYFFPSKALMIAFPIFLSRPTLLVGLPVSRANFCFIWVIPNALFNENDTPGIFMEI